MAPVLYMVPASPPVQAVQITAKALGIHLDERTVNVLGFDHLKSEYVKINPQHTVPTLVEEDGFIIWDSHAINAYLVSKYAKDDSLYPKDLKKRAVVDQRLYFDSGVAFKVLADITVPVVREGKSTINDKDKENVNQVYEFLETFLDGKPWVAGDTKTIADYNIYSTVTNLNILVHIDAKKYAKVAAWLKKVDALPEAEANWEGLQGFNELFKTLLQ